MTGMLEIVQKELKKIPYKNKVVSARLEMSRKRKPLAKAHALFYKGFEESMIKCCMWENSDQFLCGKCNSCKIHF